NIRIDEAYISLIKYREAKDFNYQFLIDYFSGDTIPDSSTSVPWRIMCKAIDIRKTRFIMRDENINTLVKGINFNDLDIKDFTLKIRDIENYNEYIKANIKNISFKEKSGFILYKLAVNASFSEKSIIADGLHFITPTSDTKMDINLKYDSLKYLSDFNLLKKHLKIHLKIKPSKLNINDIAYFLPELSGMSNIIYFSGAFYNTLNDLMIEQLQLRYGKATIIKGDIFLQNFTESIILKTDSFNINKEDLLSFRLPYNYANKGRIPLPQSINLPNNILIKGIFRSYKNNYNLDNMEIFSDYGYIKTLLSIKDTLINKHNIYRFKGKLNSKDFNAGALAQVKDLQKITMNMQIDGYGTNIDNLDMKLNGKIDSLNFKKYRYSDINISGAIANKEFNGSLTIQDQNINLNFNGMVNYSGDSPVMNFSTELTNINFNNLHFLNSDTVYLLENTKIIVDIAGDNIDNLLGYISIDNTIFKMDKKIYKLNDFKIDLTSDNSMGNKKIKLSSDYIDANISGIINFSSFYDNIVAFSNKYLPEIYQMKQEQTNNLQKNKTTEPLSKQDFNFDINLKNTAALCELIMPSLSISENTLISGSFNNYNNEFKMDINAGKIKLSGKRFETFNIKANTINQSLNLAATCKRFYLSDSTKLDNINLNAKSFNDSVNYFIKWDNKVMKHNTSADINGNINFTKTNQIKFNIREGSLITLDDSLWTFKGSNTILYDTNKICINEISLNHKYQKLAINGDISANPDDKLSINFTNFNISDFDILTDDLDINFDGVINGEVKLYKLLAQPNFITNIFIKDFAFNGDKLGDARLQNSYDYVKKGIYSNLDITYTGSSGTNNPINVKGYIYPEAKDNNFDLNITLTNLRLKALGRYLDAFASNLNGYATGSMKLTGPFDKPELTGKVKLIKTKFLVNYLNTEYVFTNDLIFGKDFISFDNVTIYGNNDVDLPNNKAHVSGKIFHNSFNNFRFDLTLKPELFTLLNTNQYQNNLYYGQAFATGNINIKGDVKNILMNIKAKTDKNTKLFIPLDSPEEISDNNFISFIGKGKDIKQSESIADISGIQLNFELEVTPDAEIQLVFDPKIGDIIKANGKSNLKMNINTNGDFSMFGDYVIESGSYLFTLQNVINKKFDIDKGSKITWNGSPYSAIIDINAIYSTRTSVDVLRPDLTALGRRVPIHCIINLKEQLMKPVVSFDIDFPDLNEFDKQSYKVAIEPELNKQVFALLILSSFTTPAQYKGQLKSTENAGNSNALTNNSTELLSNQLSNWLSQINKDFDIGVNYHAGDNISSDQVEVALSTQLFNNRLLINGNVGVGGSNRQTSQTQQSSSNIVGDVNMEYKITPDGKFRIKAFNKTNNNDYINYSTPYTQGIGFFYRKDFDKLKYIFRKNNK
ncbi:MAG: translocation/assembly module TamB, partial [Bacteroidales bacterium]|nr:translocation/assembly module TamB [Bacteroidales bacterium]